MMTIGGDGSVKRSHPKYKRTKKSDERALVFDPSVHSKNFYLASYPIVIVFNILRAVLSHLILILRAFYHFGCYIARPLSGAPELPAILLEEVTGDPAQAESHMASAKPSQPGPGDPQLAKQKHHHRKAFEYISKALKIDEENDGWLQILVC